MTSVDMEPFKDLPGYKAIFKTILKSLIQQLVRDCLFLLSH